MTITFSKRDFIGLIIIFIMGIALSMAVSRCSTYRDLNNDNVEAFTDTIAYYKDKNGELVASKLLVQAEYDKLKLINEELYNKIEAMKMKDRPDNVVHVETIVEHTKVDTVFVVKDNVAEFDFTNEWRALEGKVYTGTDSINMVIDKDEVYADYTVALKDNRVYVSSTNPYVKIKNIDGIALPKEKEKKWGIGPSLSLTYNFATKEFEPCIGLGITYSIWEW